MLKFIDAQAKFDLISNKVLELIFTFEIKYTNKLRIGPAQARIMNTSNFTIPKNIILSVF